MPEVIRTWFEIGFSLSYLVAIWVLVFLMLRRRGAVEPVNRRLTELITLMFGLLAFGDTGHVGFQVVDALSGGQTSLTGMGRLSTAITLTFFYALMLVVWQERFKKPYGWFGYLLFGAGLARLGIMALPGNDWVAAVPPQPMSTYRNLPLVVQGLGVAYLFLRDAQATGDRLFTTIGLLILASYAFYLPVILFVQQIPALGMLMVPKTLVYVAIAIITYQALYLGKRRLAAT